MELVEVVPLAGELGLDLTRGFGRGGAAGRGVAVGLVCLRPWRGILGALEQKVEGRNLVRQRNPSFTWPIPIWESWSAQAIHTLCF